MAEARTFRIRFDKQNRITFNDDLHEMTIRRRRDPVRENTVVQMSRALADGTMVDPDAVRLLGQNLYELIFFNAHSNEWFERIYENSHDLRLELEFHPQAGRLMAYPWEFLFAPRERWREGGKYLLMQSRVSLVRRIVRKPSAARTIGRPRYLVVDCLPAPRSAGQVHDREGDPLAPAHTDVLRQFFDPWGEVDRLRCPSHLALMEKMETFAPDVVHLAGHGRTERQDGGGFEFCLDPGRGPGTDRWERDERIAEALGANTPELVLLHTCKGGTTDRYGRYEGAAVALVNRGVPNVVAMQHEIQIGEANRFFRGFYEALVRGLPLEIAVREGRQAVRPAAVAAFGLPVVYTQRQEGFSLPRVSPREDAVHNHAPGQPRSGGSGDARALPGRDPGVMEPLLSRPGEELGNDEPGAPRPGTGGGSTPARRSAQENPLTIRFGSRGNAP